MTTTTTVVAITFDLYFGAWTLTGSDDTLYCAHAKRRHADLCLRIRKATGRTTCIDQAHAALRAPQPDTCTPGCHRHPSHTGLCSTL